MAMKVSDVMVGESICKDNGEGIRVDAGEDICVWGCSNIERRCCGRGHDLDHGRWMILRMVMVMVAMMMAVCEA